MVKFGIIFGTSQFWINRIVPENCSCFLIFELDFLTPRVPFLKTLYITNFTSVKITCHYRGICNFDFCSSFKKEGGGGGKKKMKTEQRINRSDKLSRRHVPRVYLCFNSIGGSQYRLPMYSYRTALVWWEGIAWRFDQRESDW